MPHLIAAVITAVIGGGVFTMAGDMAAAGANTGAVLIGWLVCIGVFCLMMCFYALNHCKPKLTGSIYSYARAGFGEFMGFNSAYGCWISALVRQRCPTPRCCSRACRFSSRCSEKATISYR